jgi:outer membrane protein assembly factor BamA
VARLAAVAAVIALALAPPVSAQEVVAEVRVHGNTLTSENEILRLGGIVVGMPLASDTAAEVADRLRASGRFERVDVLKRYASIADLSRIALVVLVDEGPVKVDRGRDGVPTVSARRGPPLMFLPLLDFQDGYGLSYGVRVTAPNPAGAGSRVTFPLIWGAEKRAAVELDKSFEAPWLTRVAGGASISRRVNPHYDAEDSRRSFWVRGERALASTVRVGATGRWERSTLKGATFREESDHAMSAGADIVFDTRIEPTFPRNAVYGRAAWDYFDFVRRPAVSQLELEGEAYVGLIGQSVLTLRAVRSDADGPLPAYLRPLFGGAGSVRGFEVGFDSGDALVAGSLDLRLPLTSPLSIGRFGMNAFVDIGAVYDEGERLADQRFARGGGGGVWLSFAVFRASLVVAHGAGAGTRVHVGTAATF